MANVLALVGILLICLAALLNILALSLNFWEKGEFAFTFRASSRFSRRMHIESRKGLWEVCSKSGNTDYICLDYDPNTDTSEGAKVVLVRAALFLSIFLLTASLVCIILKLFVLKGKQLLFHITWILSLAAGLMSLVAFTVYTSLKLSGTDYMVAFYLAIVGWLVAWAAGGLVLAASRKKDDLVVM